MRQREQIAGSGEQQLNLDLTYSVSGRWVHYYCGIILELATGMI